MVLLGEGPCSYECGTTRLSPNERSQTLPPKKPSAGSSSNVTAPSARKPFDQLKGLLVRRRLLRPLSLTEDHIRSVLLIRRARSEVLGEHLFSDPAWDILLELYAAKLGNRTMSLADIARATETPQSTTKRWVAALEDRGLVQSRIDLASKMIWLSITEGCADKLGRLTDHWGSAFLSI